MAKNVDKISAALVYQYLVKLDPSLAKKFKKKSNAAILVEDSPTLDDVALHYSKTKSDVDESKPKSNNNSVTESKSSSSEDEKEEDEEVVIKQSKGFSEGVIDSNFNRKNNNFYNRGNKSFGGETVTNPYQRAGTSRPNAPFRRVDDSKVEVDERLQSNSFAAKKNAWGSYGEKAYHDLKNTKGKGFKHEKTKKKRGNYRGGKIDIHAVNSIKFED